MVKNIYLKPDKEELGTVDYIVLVGMLSGSLAIGSWYAWSDRKKQTNEEFLMGGKNMKVLPVSLSLLASFVSSTVILGWPIAVFVQGINMTVNEVRTKD